MDYQRIKKIQHKHKYHILPIQPGQLLEIHENVGEGDTKRIQRFKGTVIKVKKPQHHDGTFTIRGLVAGHMIEKIYPLSFPKFEKILLLDQYKVRRAKLYYLRTKIWKQAKLKSILERDQKGTDLLKLALDEVSARPTEEIKRPKEENKAEENKTEENNSTETNEVKAEKTTSETDTK